MTKAFPSSIQNIAFDKIWKNYRIGEGVQLPNTKSLESQCGRPYFVNIGIYVWVT